MKHIFLPLAVIALLQSALPGAVSAQQIRIGEDPEAATRPETTAPTPSSPSARPSGLPIMEWQQPTPEAAAASEAAPIRLPLRPMVPQAGQTESHRIQGQFAEATFIMFLPRALTGAQLELTTLSSINVLPESSVVEVMLNGLTIGSITPDNFTEPQLDALPVPDGALRAGRNEVTLKVKQVHRVFCGPDASFGVWTDVQLSQSGVEIAPDQLGADPLGFLAAISAQLGRGQPMQVIDTGTASYMLQGASFIAQIEHLFEGLPPQIAVDDPYKVSSGTPQLARVTALPPDLAPDGLPLFRRGGDGAIVLLANADRPEQVKDLLLGAVGNRALERRPPLITPGAPRSLDDLGYERLVGQGRYIHETVPFRLPSDWMLLSSQRAALNLDYGFDQDLPEGALLLVKINGQTVRLLPLDEPEKAGKRLETLHIPFQVNRLNPDINQLTFEALVPGDPPDQACVPRDTPIFEVFETTSLDIPKAPSMTVPRLDRVLAALDPAGISFSDAGQTTLPLGLLPQVASIFVTEDTAARRATRPVSLTIGIPSDLSSLQGDVIEGNAPILQESLLRTTEAQEPEIDTWASIDDGRWWNLMVDRDRAMEALGNFRGRLMSFWSGPQSELNSWMEGKSAEALLLQPNMQNPGDLWLIVRPNSSSDRLVASLIAMRETLDGPQGQLSIFSAERGWESWQASSQPVQLLEPLSLSNARSVVGNYASLAPAALLLPMFLLSIIAAVLAMGFMIVSRRGKK